MSDDLVQRLRTVSAFDDIPELTEEAADRIEALTAKLNEEVAIHRESDSRISSLEAALREIIKVRKLNHSVSILRIAELALEGKP
jgi:hypothetical protein